MDQLDTSQLAVFATSGPVWVAIPVGDPLIVDNAATSYETLSTRWSPQMRTARGIRLIVNDPIPEGKVQVGLSLIDDGGTPRRVWTLVDLSLGERRKNLCAQVDALRDAALARGFTYNFGAAGIHTLQTRDTDDKINWLTSQAAYGAAVASGAGAAMGATFRSADNATFTVSYAEGLAALLAMAAWGGAIFARSWELKDAIAAAANEDALSGIETDEGWPA